MGAGPLPPTAPDFSADSPYYAAHPLQSVRDALNLSNSGPPVQAQAPYDPVAELKAVSGDTAYDPQAELAAVSGEDENPSAARSLFDHFTNGLVQNFGPKIQGAGEALGYGLQRAIGRQPTAPLVAGEPGTTGSFGGDYAAIRDYWMNQLAAETAAHRDVAHWGGALGEIASPVNAALPAAGDGASAMNAILKGALAASGAAGINAAGDVTSGNVGDYAQHMALPMAAGLVLGGGLTAGAQKLGRLATPSQAKIDAARATMAQASPSVLGQPVKDLVSLVRANPKVAEMYEQVRINHASDIDNPQILPPIGPARPKTILPGIPGKTPPQVVPNMNVNAAYEPTNLPVTAFDQMKKSIDQYAAGVPKQEGQPLQKAINRIITGGGDDTYASVDQQAPLYTQVRAMESNQPIPTAGKKFSPMKAIAGLTLAHHAGPGAALVPLLAPRAGESANIGAHLLTGRPLNAAAAVGSAMPSLMFPPDTTQGR
jgi:hypothetical protein